MWPCLAAMCGLRRQWLALVLPLLSSGCAHYVGRGSDLYYEGRYIEAAHVLEKSEPRLEGGSFEEQAEYGLYRGATLLRLGDLDGAGRWLEFSRLRLSESPGALTAEELELLQESLIALRVDLDRRAAAGGF
jgi:hypothetical protein